VWFGKERVCKGESEAQHNGTKTARREKGIEMIMESRACERTGLICRKRLVLQARRSPSVAA